MPEPVRIVPAEAGHIAGMVGRLRPEHVAELALHGLTDRAALEQGLRASVVARTALEGEQPIAMWGITVPMVLADTAHPWVITTADTMRHKKRFWREIRAAIAAMHALYPVLANEFDTDDGEAVRLLRRLGFFDVGPAGRFRTFVSVA